jgi:hypothetical protein
VHPTRSDRGRRTGGMEGETIARKTQAPPTMTTHSTARHSGCSGAGPAIIHQLAAAYGNARSSKMTATLTSRPGLSPTIDQRDQ